MKKIFNLAMALAIVMLAAATISCSKDKEKSNYYIYDGKHFDVAWAGYYYNSEYSGYCFGISPTVPAGQLPNESNYFEVDCPEPLLGQEADLSVFYNKSWPLLGYFRYNSTLYYFEEDNRGHISGSNNRVKITKNSENNFTIEFSMTIGGKKLEGKYSGNFQKKADYFDIGLPR